MYNMRLLVLIILLQCAALIATQAIEGDTTICASPLSKAGNRAVACGATNPDRPAYCCPGYECSSVQGRVTCRKASRQDAPAATPPPPPPPPPPGPISLEDSENRMIAYLGNWQACPTASQIAEYTHIVIAFAVTYSWNPTKNICDQTCKIGAPVPICENANKQYLVDEWRAMGKKVILSFGGAGMGGEFR